MVTAADGDMWGTLAVKVMGSQVPARDLRIYRLPDLPSCCEREVSGLLGDMVIEGVISWSCHYPSNAH